MKVTHFFKDHCKYYWRVECTLVSPTPSAGQKGGWDICVFRSDESHEDPNANEVFSTSQDREQHYEPNIELVIFQMSQYFNNAFLTMVQDVELYTPEWDKTEQHT